MNYRYIRPLKIEKGQLITDNYGGVAICIFGLGPHTNQNFKPGYFFVTESISSNVAFSIPTAKHVLQSRCKTFKENGSDLFRNNFHIDFNGFFNDSDLIISLIQKLNLIDAANLFEKGTLQQTIHDLKYIVEIIEYNKKITIKYENKFKPVKDIYANLSK